MSAAGTLVRIERLGGRGDGIARLPDGRQLFVAGTLPGEEVMVGPVREGRAEPIGIVVPSPERVTPACIHVDRCGGCSLQHLSMAGFARFVEAKVANALAARGLDAPVAPAILSPPGARRRLRLGFSRRKGRVWLGHRARRSHDIVDLAMCPIAEPALVALVPPLREVLGRLGAAEGELALDRTASGIDLVVLTAAPPTLDDRMELAAFAEAHDLARISWRTGRAREAEPVIVRRLPVLRHGELVIDQPAGGFRQPTDQGEAAIRTAVGAHLAGCTSVIDLFGGTGALGLALSPPPTRLTIVEADPLAVSTVQAALRRRPPSRRIEAVRRDLDRAPLPAAELDRADGIIIDPPRRGAEAQAAELARARPPRIAYVSCDPGTFARDARLLVDGGHRLVRVVPIGQFLWSDQIELVATFTCEPA